GEESAFCRGAHPFAFFAKRRGLFPKPRRGGCPHPPGWDFFRGVEQNLLSHTCHSEERRDESLLSNTCHSESALAVRNLLFAKQWELFPSHVGAGALTCPIPFLSPLSS